MPIAFNPPPLPSPQLQPPAKNGAGGESDDRTTTADAPSRFADLLTAAAHPRSSAPPGVQRPSEAKDDTAPGDKTADASGAPAAIPLWLPGMAAPTLPALPPPAAPKLSADAAAEPGSATVAVAAATRGLTGAATSSVANPRTGCTANTVEATKGDDEPRPATTAAQEDAAADVRNAGGWSALHFAAPAAGEAKMAGARAGISAADGTNAPLTPAASHTGGIAALAGAPSPDLRPPDRVETVVSVRVDHPVGSPAWADDVGTKLAHVVSLRHEEVELHVQPPHLGPVDIRISINGDQASVQFVAPHATTRDALENALPQLRDLLAQQGLALSDTSIGSRAQDDSASGAANRDDRTSARDVDFPATASAQLATGTLRLLDVFA